MGRESEGGAPCPGSVGADSTPVLGAGDGVPGRQPQGGLLLGRAAGRPALRLSWPVCSSRACQRLRSDAPAPPGPTAAPPAPLASPAPGSCRPTRPLPAGLGLCLLARGTDTLRTVCLPDTDRQSETSEASPTSSAPEADTQTDRQTDRWKTSPPPPLLRDQALPRGQPTPGMQAPRPPETLPSPQNPYMLPHAPPRPCPGRSVLARKAA